MDTDLAQLETKVKNVIQNEKCSMTVMAWTVAVYWSLYRAKKLDHTEDRFRKLKPKVARQTLLKVLAMMDQAEQFKGNQKMWLSGHYYNNAILRMHALVEQSLKTLWERVNSGSLIAVRSGIVGDYRFQTLLSWYREVFNVKEDHLGALHKEVNELKHEYKTIPQEKLKMREALIAFDKALDLLLKSFENRQSLIAIQKKSHWYKKQVLTITGRN